MTHNAYALASLVSLAFLWVYLFWLYRDFRVDQFRQQMFSIRDDMFDAASEGRLSFDDDAYGILRVTANGFIRFGHVLSLSNYLATSYTLRGERVELPRIVKKLEDALGAIPAERTKLYRAYQTKIHRLVIKHIILNSPVLLVTIVVPVVLYFFAIVERKHHHLWCVCYAMPDWSASAIYCRTGRRDEEAGREKAGIHLEKMEAGAIRHRRCGQSAA